MHADQSHDDVISRAPGHDLPEAVPLLATLAPPAAFFTAWSGLGLVAALLLYRRGESLVPSLLMGLGFGPLAFVPATSTVPAVPDVLVRRGVPGGGAVDVVAGVRGWDSGALAAADAALGERIRRLVGVAVVDAEAMRSAGAELRSAGAELRSAVVALEVAGALVGRDPQLVVVAGRDDRAVVDYASRAGCQLVVLPRGARSPGGVCGLRARRQGVRVVAVGDRRGGGR